MRSAAAVILTALLVGGCGSGDDGDSDNSADSGDRTTDAAATDCATTLVATYPDGGEVPLDVSAQAIELADGAAYTLFAGDFEIGTEAIATVTTVIPPEGSHVATIAVTVFDGENPTPITSGTTVEHTTDSGTLTFSTVLHDSQTSFGDSSNASGELTVVDVTDESICIDVDYADDEKALSGRVFARVHDSPL